jgi:hypothetical protein
VRSFSWDLLAGALMKVAWLDDLDLPLSLDLSSRSEADLETPDVLLFGLER